METINIDIESFIKDHWSSENKENAKTVLEFIQTLMNDHNLDLIRKQYAGVNYVQHNRNMKDGIEGLIEYFKTLTKRFPDFAFEVKDVFVDGEFVIVHSHSTMNKKHRGNDKKGFNITDRWRVKDGKLVAHWDSVQAIDGGMRLYYWMTGGTINNSNGVF